MKIFLFVTVFSKMQLDSRSTSTRKMSSMCPPLLLLVAVLQGTIVWQGKGSLLPLWFRVYGANLDISLLQTKYIAFSNNGKNTFCSCLEVIGEKMDD